MLAARSSACLVNHLSLWCSGVSKGKAAGGLELHSAWNTRGLVFAHIFISSALGSLRGRPQGVSSCIALGALEDSKRGPYWEGRRGPRAVQRSSAVHHLQIPDHVPSAELLNQFHTNPHCFCSPFLYGLSLYSFHFIHSYSCPVYSPHIV